VRRLVALPGRRFLLTSTATLHSRDEIGLMAGLAKMSAQLKTLVAEFRI
jgi:hypothetical protein